MLLVWRDTHRHKAPHVVEMIIAFNDFCMWVSTTLLSYERIKVPAHGQKRVSALAGRPQFELGETTPFLSP